MDVGKQIKYYRVINNLSQKNLAKQLHVAVSTISNWENGRNQVNPDYYQGLANIFKINISELLEKNMTSKAELTSLSSRPYISYRYKPLIFIWILIVIIIVLSMASPIKQMIIDGLLGLAWIILIVYAFLSYIKNSHQNIAIKYYKDNEKLVYVHPDEENKIKLKKQKYLVLAVFTWLSVNVTIIIGFAVLIAHSNDALTRALLPINLILLNLIMGGIIMFDGREKYKGKTIEYTSMNTHFFLARNKLLLVFYGGFYFYFFIQASMQNIALLEDFGFILLMLVMSLNLIAMLILLEMNMKYYAKYKIHVK